MKANYGKLLSRYLPSILGITAVSLLITLPSGAEVVPNQNVNIRSKVQIAQATNPRPRGFNEPPYNRGSRTAPTDGTLPTNTLPTNTLPTDTSPTRTPPAAGSVGTKEKHLIAVIESNSSFTTLFKALKAAGLTEVLQGKGPFTIFAPTDAAFAELPQDALQDLLKPENKEVLVKLLTYHVVPGKVLASDLNSGQVNSLQGDPITVKVDQVTGVITVNDAEVKQADIQGSNGVIHQINKVVLPPSL
jgi:uncharacterized surface protein with fasciclin (FAS1) repeats